MTTIGKARAVELAFRDEILCSCCERFEPRAPKKNGYPDTWGTECQSAWDAYYIKNCKRNTTGLVAEYVAHRQKVRHDQAG
jgi:hypothetical protein